MRIISDFHDYYDWVKSYDLEQRPIWQRLTSSAERRKLPSVIKHLCQQYQGMDRPRVILLCGRPYPFLSWSADWRPGGEPAGLAYELDEIVERGRRLRPNRWNERWFDRRWRELAAADLTAFQVELGTPLALCGEDWVVRNPRLLDWGFQGRVEATDLWQRVEQFFRSHLTEQPEIPAEISDEDMGRAKGLLGKKYDFRRPPKEK